MDKSSGGQKPHDQNLRRTKAPRTKAPLILEPVVSGKNHEVYQIHDVINLKLVENIPKRQTFERICDSSIVKPIFETCLVTGIFPGKWKMSNVCPIHKKKSKNDKSNYRPISLLHILSKIFEKIIFESLYSYFTKNNLQVNCQSGFYKR